MSRNMAPFLHPKALEKKSLLAVWKTADTPGVYVRSCLGGNPLYTLYIKAKGKEEGGQQARSSSLGYSQGGL